MTAWIHSSENLFLYDNFLFSKGVGEKQGIRQIKLQNYYFINAYIGLWEAFRICQPSYMIQEIFLDKPKGRLRGTETPSYA